MGKIKPYSTISDMPACTVVDRAELGYDCYMAARADDSTGDVHANCVPATNSDFKGYILNDIEKLLRTAQDSQTEADLRARLTGGDFRFATIGDYNRLYEKFLNGGGYKQVCRGDTPVDGQRVIYFSKVPEVGLSQPPACNNQVLNTVDHTGPLIFKDDMRLTDKTEAVSAWIASMFPNGDLDHCGGKRFNGRTNSDGSKQYELTITVRGNAGTLELAARNMQRSIDSGLPDGVPIEWANAVKQAVLDAKSADPTGLQKEGLNLQKLAITIQVVISAAMFGAIVVQIRKMNQMMAIQTRMIELQTGGVKNALEKYAVNLNEEYKAGRLEPVDLGARNAIIKRTRAALMRHKSAVWTSDLPGVGKSALAEGLAMGIADGKFQELKNAEVWSVDLNRLKAGASYIGQFEDRLQALIDEVAELRKQGRRIILNVEELHTLPSAGQATGSSSPLENFKPALARGEIELIGSSTKKEFAETIGKNPALRRRFIEIEVPDFGASEVFSAMKTKRGVVGKADGIFPEIKITDEAIAKAISLGEHVTNRGEALVSWVDDLIKNSISTKRLDGIKKPKGVTELTAEDVQSCYNDTRNGGDGRGPKDPPPPAPAGGPSFSLPPAPSLEGLPGAPTLKMIGINPLAPTLPPYLQKLVDPTASISFTEPDGTRVTISSGAQPIMPDVVSDGMQMFTPAERPRTAAEMFAKRTGAMSADEAAIDRLSVPFMPYPGSSSVMPEVMRSPGWLTGIRSFFRAAPKMVRVIP